MTFFLPLTFRSKPLFARTAIARTGAGLGRGFFLIVFFCRCFFVRHVFIINSATLTAYLFSKSMSSANISFQIFPDDQKKFERKSYKKG